MITPQQIHEVSFEKVRRGGYDMDAVDAFLEPLTEDYITLFKENSVLKSKMRVLVEKLEEYRKQESTMQSALLAAQKTCEQMTLETEKKCARMLREAEEAASAKSQNTDLLIDGEQERLQAAQEASRSFLDTMEQQLLNQVELLRTIRDKEIPLPPAPEKAEPRKAFDFEEHPVPPTTEERADALILEIDQSLETKLSNPDATKKYDNLAFGKNYQPDNA